MSDTLLARDLTPREFRAEVSSIEALHQERRDIIARHGKLIARYGPFGMGDDFRKQMVEALKVGARMDLAAELKAENKKPTEDQITARAYGSAEYLTFINNAESEKIEWLGVQNRLDEISELIRSREAELRAYTAEIGLR